MAEYIEREELKKVLSNEAVHCLTFRKTGEARGLVKAKEIVSEIPTADVVEVMHGEWETKEVTQEWDKVEKFGHFHNDPNCKFFYSDEDPRGHDYCPNCGTKMDGKVGNQTHLSGRWFDYIMAMSIDELASFFTSLLHERDLEIQGKLAEQGLNVSLVEFSPEIQTKIHREFLESEVETDDR